MKDNEITKNADKEKLEEERIKRNEKSKLKTERIKKDEKELLHAQCYQPDLLFPQIKTDHLSVIEDEEDFDIEEEWTSDEDVDDFQEEFECKLSKKVREPKSYVYV
jgi:hypothetical protein